MPTYTYKCPTHSYFEFKSSMSDHQAHRPCPTCGVDSFQHILTTQPPIFKGGGWTRPDPWIPPKIRNMTEAELDADLGLTNDANKYA